jgi:hypothetical protein
MIRARTIHVGVLCLVALGAFAACEAQTGPDAPARENGCIDTECKVSSSSSGSSGDAGKDAE